MQNKRGASFALALTQFCYLWQAARQHCGTKGGCNSERGQRATWSSHAKLYENACDKEAVGKCENISTEVRTKWLKQAAHISEAK